jgi:pimeloyl-ACP methyl ester carboxylesterase/lysophospholipase L1-like esterase
MIMKKILFLLFLTILLIAKEGAAQTESDWNGYKCLDFKFEDRDAKIVFPKTAENGRHWIWRARFWGHEPQTDLALLDKGFHLVYIDLADFYGSPAAVQYWNRFYQFLTGKYQLNSKAVLEGMSRGGLFVYNWASENTDKVACIYADAPVCDFKSWPGGFGKGKGSPEDWKKCLAAYQLTEESAKNYIGIPVLNSRKIAEVGIPALHVCGAIDDVVPIDENSYALEKVFKEAGGDIKIIVKEGIGHHPHSLKDPTPIVRFILSHTSPELLSPEEPITAKMSINFRSSLDNCRVKFEKEKKGKVAFLGGSITYNPGWRDSVCNYLKNKFPETEFEFINAGIPSTGSTPGAMRLERDVLSHGKIDLLFEEAAVNDATNGFSPEAQLRGMEGIVRHALKSNPEMDIVMMHFVDQDKMADYNNGKVPKVIVQHEKVADYYQIASINLAKEVNDRIINGEFNWRDDFKNLHPSPFGQEIYFRTIKHFFETDWSTPSQKKTVAHKIPKQPLDHYSYYNGHFEPIKNAKLQNGWQYIEKWDPTDQAGTRKGFVSVPVLEAIQPGSELSFNFKGKAIGIMVTAGPDAGILEYSIDGQPFKTIDQFTEWSNQLHLPWLFMLNDKLSSGKHILTLKTSENKNPKSSGTACRIHNFAIN